MRIIGLIGGMNWESTVRYYRVINAETHRLLGRQHNAKSILYTVDFAEIEACPAQDRWDDAAAMLGGAARALGQAEAQRLPLRTKPPHKVARAIAEAAGTATFIHIADPTGGQIRRRRLCAGALHRILYEELCDGRVMPPARERLPAIIGSLRQQGAQGVVSGCTEIGLLLSPVDIDVAVFDTAHLHARAAMREARPARALTRCATGARRGPRSEERMQTVSSALRAASPSARGTARAAGAGGGAHGPAR